MFGIAVAVIVLAGIGIIAPLVGIFTETYGSRLEKYIVNNNPINAADVDRLTREYQEREQRTFL